MSQHSTGLSDHERSGIANVISVRGPPTGGGSQARGVPAGGEPALDYVYRLQEWCAMVGIDRTTAWRMIRNGKGPTVTKLTGRLIGIRHRHHLAWLESREQTETAA